jgi:zinc D-Ala-D-Ala carboxypeptidase
MNLTSHFTLEELARSDRALELGIDNTPPAEAVENLKRLAPFLEQVRALLGNHPLQITSGYRCPALNQAVGGVANSAHLFGLAADFVCPDAGTMLSICARLRGAAGLAFDQLINEANRQGHRWVHVGIAESGTAPRGEVWTVDAGGTRPGL